MIRRERVTSIGRVRREEHLDDDDRTRAPRVSPTKLTSAQARDLPPAHLAGVEPGKLTLADVGRDLLAPAQALRYAETCLDADRAAPESGWLASAFDWTEADVHRSRREATFAQLRTLASLLGVDTFGLRVNVDDGAARRLGTRGARGSAHGDELDLDPALEPGTEAWRYVLAHELAHVAQSRLRWVLGTPRLSAEAEAHAIGEAWARGEAVARPVVPLGAGVAYDTDSQADDDKLIAQPFHIGMDWSVTQISCKAPDKLTYVAGLSKELQVTAAVVFQLVGAANYTPALAREAQSKVMKYVGRIVGPARQAEVIGEFTIDMVTMASLIEFLRDTKKLVLDDKIVTADRLAILAVGVDVQELWHGVFEQDPTLLYRWYTLPMFAMFCSSNQALFKPVQDAMGAIRTKTSKAKEAAFVEVLQKLIDGINRYADVLEAIRQDAGCVDVPGYRAIWNLPAAEPDGPVEPPAPADAKPNAAIAYNFLHELVSEHDRAMSAKGSHEERKQLLINFASRQANNPDFFVGGDTTLRDRPSKANSPPLPSELRIYPGVHPPFFDTAVGSEKHASMTLAFPDVYEAFATYAYRWEVIRVPDDLIQNAATVGDDMDVHGSAPGHWDTMTNRLSRDVRYAKADVKRAIDHMSEELGPPNAGALTLAGVASMMRAIGSVVKTFFEVLTKPKNEKTIPFEDEGLFLVRCIATPRPTDETAVVRASAVAWTPLWVHHASDMSEMRVERAIKEETAAEKRLRVINDALDAGVTDEAERAALTEEREGIETALSGDLGEQLRHERKSLTQQKKQLKGPGSEQYREAIEKRVGEIDKILKLRTSRMGSANEKGMEKPFRLIAAFASDDGNSMMLGLEAYQRHAEKGKVEYRVIDSTTKKSGFRDSGLRPTREDAIEKAIRTILENSNTGYGRGYCSVQIPAKEGEAGAGVMRTIRIEKDFVGIMMEGIEGATMLISIVAIAAAPFTAGASLAILLPVGLIGAVPSAYRLMDKSSQGTLEWDLETAADLANIIGGLAGAGSGLKGLGKLGGAMYITGLGSDGLGFAVAGAQFLEQIAALDPNMPPGARRAAIMQLVGNQMLSIGIQIGGQLAAKGAQEAAAHSVGGAAHVALPRVEGELHTNFAKLVDADVHIYRDESDNSSTVKVEYDADGDGLVTGVHVKMGKHADAAMLNVHAGTVKTLLKYKGLGGRVRLLVDRVRAFVSGKKQPLPGSRAFDALGEVTKLPRVIKSIQDRVRDGTMDRSDADVYVDHLLAEMERHAKSLDEFEAGDNFIAMQAPVSADAVKAGYKPAPDGHFYEQLPDGTFQLRTHAGYDGQRKMVNAQKEIVDRPAESKLPDDPATAGVDAALAPKPPKTQVDTAAVRAAVVDALGMPADRVKIVTGKEVTSVRPPDAPGGIYEVWLNQRDAPDVAIHNAVKAVDAHLAMAARRPKDPAKDRTTIGEDGKKRPWTAREEAAYLGRPEAGDGYHWAFHEGDLRHVRDEVKRDDGTDRPKMRYDEDTGTLVEDKTGRTDKNPKFPDGTSKAQAFEDLGGNDPETPFGKWIDVVIELGLAKDRADVMAHMKKDPAGVSRKTVRGWMKDALGDLIIGKITDRAALKKQHPALYKGKKDKYDLADADAAASHIELIKITDKLDSADKGSLAEQWYAKIFGNDTLDTQVPLSKQQLQDAGVTSDIDRVLDVVIDGNTIKDIKHVKEKLGNTAGDRTFDQFQVLEGLVGKTVDIRGTPTKIDKLVYVFSDPAGAVANANWIVDRLKAAGGDIDLRFEIFDRRGGTRVLTFDDLMGSDFNTAGGPENLARAIGEYAR